MACKGLEGLEYTFGYADGPNTAEAQNTQLWRSSRRSMPSPYQLLLEATLRRCSDRRSRLLTY